MRVPELLLLILCVLCVVPTNVFAGWDAALTELKDEPKIAGVYLEKRANVLSIGVMDDGTRRDGYAMYVCEVLREHGVPGRKIVVKIVDSPKLTVLGEYAILGKHVCTLGN